jgi:hypothetical protein
MADDMPIEQPRKSHHSPKSRIGRSNRQHSTKGSYTSPRKIHRRKRMAEALGYRERGWTFEKIAQEMKCSMSVAHGYVVEGMNLVPLESAKVVLGIELKRLDALFAGHFEKACKGDVGATYAALQIVDRRARLLGLYPQHGAMAQILVQAQSGEMQVPSIEFIVPGVPGGERVSPADMAAPPAPPFAWQRQLEPPRERYPTPFRTVEVEAEPPRQGPRTELDPGAPRPQGGGGESRLWGRSGKSTDWMGS